MASRVSARRSTRQITERSYQDPSSDEFEVDDIVDDGEADFYPRREPTHKATRVQRHQSPAPGPSTKRRSARQLADRKHSIYYDPSSDDLDVEDNEEFASGLQQPRKRRRVTKPLKRQTRAAAAQVERKRSKSSKRKRSSKEKKRRLIGAPYKPKSVKKATRFAGPSDHVTPAWTTLPLEILRDVFIFASQPMQEQTTTASANVGWLMRTARTCRAFAIPALEAYYQSPYALTSYQPHHLLELLQIPQDKTYIHYRVKVRDLEFDVRRLAYTATGKDRFDVSALVRLTPQLQHLQIVHPVDAPPFRVGQVLQKWRYPTDLFQALNESDVKLKSWRWTRDMIPNVDDADIYTYMSLAHTSKPFEYLDKLVVSGFDANNSTVSKASEATEDEANKVPRLAAVVSQLLQLEDLTFISCDIIMEDFLEHVPKNLRRLELSNCLELTSTMLIKYFSSGGAHLRELVLNHNSAVDLMFLPQLKALCPRLEILKMDLTYYSERHNYNDAWAMYDALLTEDDIPSWPSTLRHLELMNLQKWSAEAAQNLFRSLVDAARDLPDLRYLVIQAHISIPWRDRAQFRDQWIDRLNTVYLRRSEDPSPFLGSLRQHRLYKDAITKGRAVVTEADLETDDESSTRHRLSHVQVSPVELSTSLDSPKYSDVERSPDQAAPATSRRSVRVKQRVESQNVSTAAEDDSDVNEEASGSDDWHGDTEAFIQGLCNVVDIRIDNQRPRENQYTEANFLDTEPSGDEDWHEGADISDGGYAW